jgi:hypothetical protein
MRARPLSALASALVLTGGCAPATPSTTSDPSRVVIVEANGTAMRQSTADENATVTFAAPMDRVWAAVVVGYAELGIDPSIADRAGGHYGNRGFVAARRMAGRPLGDYFHCGSGLGGPRIDSGRLTADVLTSLTAAPDGGTVVTTHVSGRVRSNDGTSTDPIVCGSTGALEEHLRTTIAARVKGAP